MTPLIDFVAHGSPDLLPTEEVCQRCHLAKHAAGFQMVKVYLAGMFLLPDVQAHMEFRVCADCAGGGA